MISFKIDTIGKQFVYNKKLYTTPCSIFLNSNNEIEKLRRILAENSITYYRIQNKIKSTTRFGIISKMRILQPGTVSLSISIG